MRFRETLELAHPIDRVKRAYGRRDFFLERYRQLGFSKLELLRDGGDGEAAYEIAFTATQKTDLPLPAFAKKLLGETQQVQQEERWDLARGEGRISTSPRGVPVAVRAKVRMVEVEGGTRLEMDWEIEAKIPLLGGKIEKLAADEVRARMPVDAALSNDLVGRFGER
jgi:uncharacterized protein DUF2505